MAERKVKVEYLGKMVDGVEVDINESTERWSDVRLADGTVLKVKLSIVVATRVPGEYDQDGNPAYVLKMSPTMIVSETPPQFRRKT